MENPLDSQNGVMTSQVFISVIRVVIPHLNVYLIADPSSARHDMVACRADNSANMLFQGTQTLSTLTVGTRVVAIIAPGSERIAIILAAVPQQVVSNVNLIRSNVMRSQAGMVQDLAYNILLPTSNPEIPVLIPDFSAGTPVDTLPGDWGYITEAGLFVSLGSLVASLGASSFCKMEFFALDDLARLSSINYEHRGSALDHRILNDGNEYNEIRMIAPNTWEGAGVKNHVNYYDIKEGKIKQGEKNAYYEPRHEEQQGIFRQQKFNGFLGNGSKEYIACLSPQHTGDYLKYSDKSPYIGLLEISKGLNGAYSIKSAKEITLEKTIIIPVPKELILPEDELGDNTKNYTSAGVVAGEPHNMKEYGKGLSPSEKVAALYDYHAYVYNKYNISPFVEHKKDWHVPEESGTNSVKYNLNLSEGGIYKPKLLSKFQYDRPSATNLTIDGREEHNVDFYASRSIIKQLDDGSILIEDGYGSQFLMSQGNITITCPGDIIQRPGRSLITWAPDDIILRAGSSADITTSKGDIRLKSEKNLHMLGGNSGTGGVLIESKGSGAIQGAQFNELGEKAIAPGIILKASASDVYIYGQDKVYTGVISDKGQIINDAKSGTIYNAAKDKIDNLESNSIINIGIDKTQFILTATGGILNSALVTDTLVVASRDRSSVAISGGLYVEDSILTKGGIGAIKAIVSESGASPFPVEEGTIGDIAERIQTQVDNAQSTAETVKSNLTDKIKSLDDQLIQNENSPANENTVKKVAFSCRTKEDYGITDDFSIVEARWQQLYYADSVGLKWEEPVVKVDGKDDTSPHPGIQAWVGNDNVQALTTVKLKNFDLGTGLSKARADISANDPEVVPKTLVDGYLITKQIT